MASAGADPSRLSQIDVLRGLAALGVFIFHAEAFPSKRTLPPVTIGGHTFTDLPNVFSLGAYGVSLFFVISGFCLALQQWRQRPHDFGRLDLPTYARNRVARIVPAYWTAVAIAGVVAVSLGNLTLTGAARQALIYAVFLHGMSGTTVLSFNSALWSMVTESQFYLAFPLLLALYRRTGRLGFLMIVGGVNLIYRFGILLLPDVHQLAGSIELVALLALQLPGRCLEFALGMALADIYVNERDRTRWCLPLLAVSTPVALLVRLRGPAALVEMLFGLVFFALVGALILPHPRADVRAGAVRAWMAAFGRASYSFFLIHAPVLFIVRKAFPSLDAYAPHPRPYLEYLLTLITAFSLSLAAAIALYRGVELPLWERLRVSTRRSPASSPAVVARGQDRS